MTLPLVSVIIPTYNYGQYLTEAIRSLEGQTYPLELIEVVIIDDGSTDHTRTLIPQLLAGSPLDITYTYQDNAGKGNATRKAIAATSGKYIFNLDADDYFLSHKIFAYVETFERHSAVVHVGSAAYSVRGELEELFDIWPQFKDRPLDGRQMAIWFHRNNDGAGGGSSFAARGDVLRALPIPDAVDMYTDEYLTLGMMCQGHTYFIGTPQSVWRIHGNNYSGSRQGIESMRRKALRMDASSAGTLSAIAVLPAVPREVVEIYKVKHLVRKLIDLEGLGIKRASDVIAFARAVAGLKIDVRTMARQHVFSRLLPQRAFDLRKASRKRRAQAAG